MSENASAWDATNGHDLMSDTYQAGSGLTGGFGGAGNAGASSFMPGVNSFLDLLKTGVPHYAAYQSQKLAYQNQPTPVYVNALGPSQAQVINQQSLVKWALIGAAVFLVISMTGNKG
ncbi:MAG: hypothetical protein V4706_14725 [Pseudomonadota bacterium]